MITKKTLTRQSIDELSKVCPGVTVPKRAMSTIYGCGNGSANSPFTWDEYQAFLDQDYVSATPFSGLIYYLNESGNLEAATFIGAVDVSGNRPGGSGNDSGNTPKPEDEYVSGNKYKPEEEEDKDDNRIPPTGGGGGGGTDNKDDKDEDYQEPNITGKLPDPKPKKNEYVADQPCVFNTMAGVWAAVYGKNLSHLGYKNPAAFSSAIEAKYYADYRDPNDRSKVLLTKIPLLYWQLILMFWVAKPMNLLRLVCQRQLLMQCGIV